ncbi:DUF1642 domain-containing protein [Lactococcus lactis]|uniref:DUF1642 domain-containing protein n=1 Tax=Lactococcus lactis TaxID=1358 RepID=UPI002415E356|nr:DUF1642 domain-containing protein [Lactococcus lactis]MDG4957947.1 DUF1642 domain-containing protein [Lactococcus lactis]
MNKFEEKLEKLPIKTIQHPVGDTEYYAAVHVKTLIAQADEEIANLKSQIQQQALPVVPDFVDKFLKSKPIFNIVKYPIPIEIISWANKQTGYMDLEINITCLIKLKTNGYTVEKPQLFYLKEKNFGYYIANEEMPGIDSPTCMYIENAEKFTQSDIDSMHAESYELVPVEDGE